MKPLLNLLPLLLLTLGLGAAEPPVAVYDDKGATGKGIPCVTEIAGRTADINLTRLMGADIAAGGLKGYDLVVFTGGSGIPAPAHLDGADISPLLRDPKAEWKLPAVTTWMKGNHAVRSQDRRYMRYDFSLP